MSASTAPAWAAIKDVFDQCASEARTGQKGRKDKPVPLEIQSEEEFEALDREGGGLVLFDALCEWTFARGAQLGIDHSWGPVDDDTAYPCRGSHPGVAPP